jgi:hypothetical protein
MLRRRRPLLRAAAVAGAGYIAGKKAGERDGEEGVAASGPQTAAPAAPAAPAAAGTGISNASIDRLKQLAELRDQGVLTDEEFNAEKGKVLDGA